MQMIAIEDLRKIWKKYELPKDIRAEKEIEEASIDLFQWEEWMTPEKALPEDEANVLAIISGRGGNIIYDQAYVLASYFKGEGWDVEATGLEGIEADQANFVVEKWTPLPTEWEELEKPQCEIKNCPLCGGKAKIRCKFQGVLGKNTIQNGFVVGCDECNIYTNVFDSSIYQDRNGVIHVEKLGSLEAIDAWNRRGK